MQVLIETRMNSLKLNENVKPKKGCLGRIEGICADFKSPTRNGRLYPLGLWKKVFDNELFKEGLKCKTIFGELDHPEDRFEPLISEACIVMTDYKIDEDKGVIYAGFDILDTPHGKTLKNILDYGSVLGVSSRGQGDIVESADGEVVCEDTYEFACFDVVSTPAVKAARQSVVESLKKVETESFKESLQRQISEAKSISDLNIIRSVVRTSELKESDVDLFIESIEDKCKSLQSGEETILSENVCLNKSESVDNDKIKKSAKTIRENKKFYTCISDLRNKVSAYKHREGRYIDTIKQKDAKIESLQRTLSAYKKQSKNSIDSYQRKTDALDRRLHTTNESIRSYKSQIRSLKENISAVTNDLTSDKNALLEKIDYQAQKISDLQKSIVSYKDECDSLRKELSDSQSFNDESSRKLDESLDRYDELVNTTDEQIESKNNKIKQLTEQLVTSKDSLTTATNTNKVLCEQLRSYQDSYIEKVCKVFDVDPKSIRKSVSLKTTPEEILHLVENIRKDMDRYSKLPISSTGIDTDSHYIVENLNSNNDDVSEQNRLVSFLNLANKAT